MAIRLLLGEQRQATNAGLLLAMCGWEYIVIGILSFLFYCEMYEIESRGIGEVGHRVAAEGKYGVGFEISLL